MNTAVRDTDLVFAVPQTRIAYSIEQIRSIAIEALLRRDTKAERTLAQIEDIDDPLARRNSSAINTILAPIVTALAARGMPITYNYGAVQDALGFTDEQMHTIFCSCVHGSFMQCRFAAQMIGIVDAGERLKRERNSM